MKAITIKSVTYDTYTPHLNLFQKLICKWFKIKPQSLYSAELETEREHGLPLGSVLMTNGIELIVTHPNKVEEVCYKEGKNIYPLHAPIHVVLISQSYCEGSN